MTFEEYMEKHFSDWWARKGDGTVNVGWLKGFWLAAQGAKESTSRPDTGVEGIIEPIDMNFVSKSWGYESWIVNNPLYCGKKLFIKQGRWCSYHHHEIKDEVLYIESGKIHMIYEADDGKPFAVDLSAGYAFHVKPGLKHQMCAIEDTTIIEFSTQHMDSDSYRTSKDLVLEPL